MRVSSLTAHASAAGMPWDGTQAVLYGAVLYSGDLACRESSNRSLMDVSRHPGVEEVSAVRTEHHCADRVACALSDQWFEKTGLVLRPMNSLTN